MLVSDEQLGQWFPEVPPADRGMYRDAAEAYIGSRCRIPEGVVPPKDLVEAVRLLVARYAARQNSPEGFVGMSEFGPARISTVDRDVESLIGPYRRVVFG